METIPDAFHPARIGCAVRHDHSGLDRRGAQPSSATSTTAIPGAESRREASAGRRLVHSLTIPLVILRDGKPMTNWAVVLLTGALMAFGMAGAMSAAAGFSFSERPAGWVLKYMILPEVLLVPLWLFLEIRAGHRALSQGAK